MSWWWLGVAAAPVMVADQRDKPDYTGEPVISQGYKLGKAISDIEGQSKPCCDNKGDKMIVSYHRGQSSSLHVTHQLTLIT